jgi:hypothetical protein
MRHNGITSQTNLINRDKLGDCGFNQETMNYCVGCCGISTTNILKYDENVQ